MAESKTYYVWSPIHHHHEEHGFRVIRPGKTVTQQSLGVDDEGWAALLEGGSVRSMKYPSDLDPNNPNALSPNEHRLRALRRRQEALEREIAGVGGEAGDTTPSEVKENADGTGEPVKTGAGS